MSAVDGLLWSQEDGGSIPLTLTISSGLINKNAIYFGGTFRRKLMFDLAIGFGVGIVVGHFVPALYTQVMTWIKSKETAVVTDVTPAVVAPVVSTVVADVTKQ
jgi:hypothetical protein